MMAIRISTIPDRSGCSPVTVAVPNSERGSTESSESSEHRHQKPTAGTPVRAALAQQLDGVRY